MGQLLSRRAATSGAARQAALFHARERRKSLLDPSHGLFATHDLGLSGQFTTTNKFIDRTSPITFSTSFVVTGLPVGIILEMGGATTGLGIYINGTTLGFVAGDTAAGVTGIDITYDFVGDNSNQRMNLVASVSPNIGAAAMWINGQQVAYGETGGVFSQWAGTDVGGVGEPFGSVNGRVPAPAQVALSNVSLVAPVKAYLNQLPRQFRRTA